MTILLLVLLLAILAVFSSTKNTSRVPREYVTDEDVKIYMQEGQKIEAIKLYRKIHNVGLAEAKKAVEQMQDNESDENRK